jgi:hypothetical protein
MKTCPTCGKRRSRSCFDVRLASIDGLRSQCKECSRNAGRKWRKRNPNYARNRRKRLLDAGFCGTCGKVRIVEGTICERCAEIQKKAARVHAKKRFKQGRCRACGESRARGKTLCKKCLERYRERMTKNYWDNWEKHNRNRKAIARAQRLRIFENYGGAFCACCGEDEYVFLTIDHIENNGAQHKREIGGSGNILYRWIIQAGFPSGFQVLCWNCNEAKRFLGRCPHRRDGDARQRVDLRRLQTDVRVFGRRGEILRPEGVHGAQAVQRLPRRQEAVP